jgi:uncharacterized coiled-coil DUF342 family protein
MEDVDILKFKLNEYKESLLAELKAASSNEEKDALVAELRELNKKVGEVKNKIRELREIPKANRDRITEISKKLKAVNQLLLP